MCQTTEFLQRNYTGAVMRNESQTRINWIPLAAALGAGLALRLFFLFKSPSGSVHGTIYEARGRKWFAHVTYELDAVGRITPSDIRVPRYPVFTALFHLLGRR